MDFSFLGSEYSTGAKVLSVDFSFPGAKVQWNGKSRYRLTDHSVGLLYTGDLT